MTEAARNAIWHVRVERKGRRVPDTVLSIVFYVGAALLYKLASREGRRLVAVNTAVFLGGAMAAIAFGALGTGLVWDWRAVELGAAAGVASVTANITLLLAVRYGKLAISWTIFNLALVIPVLAGVVVWHEELTSYRVTGVLATVVALAFLGADMAGRADSSGREASGNSAMWGFLITAAFLAYGLLMTVNKAFGESGSAGNRFGYLSVYFGAGLVVSMALHVCRKPPTHKPDVLLGAGIGLCSVVGAFFLLRALARADAIIVFPSVSAGCVVMVAPLSALLFREKLGWKAWIGLVFGAAALILMS